MLNNALPWIENISQVRFQSVRGVFQEGAPVLAGSDIMEKSHIQIAVRDPTCILGYFKPRVTH